MHLLSMAATVLVLAAVTMLAAAESTPLPPKGVIVMLMGMYAILVFRAEV